MMNTIDQRKYLQVGDDFHDFTMNQLSSAFERSIAIKINAAAIESLQTKTQTDAANFNHNNKMTLSITQGQVDQYAENYDKIESWMRHYG